MKIKGIGIAFFAICIVCGVILGTTSLPVTEAGVTGERSESLSVSVAAERMNILVAGTDRTSGLTDVIMLVSVDSAEKTVSIMQIPRDTYAKYTKNSYKKLNGAYGALGGGREVGEWLSEALGVKIHRYLVLSPDALCSIVDSVGGVTVELDAPMYYSDPYQNLVISLPKGRQKLDGKAAEQFIRYREGYANGDLGRLDAQKVFLTALVEQISSDTSAIRLTRIFASVMGKTDTDLKISDISALSGAFSNIDRDRIFFVTAPGEALTAAKSGASYYALSAPAMEELLVSYFGAEKGGFDKNRVFLNESYQSFTEVYRKYIPYSVKRASDMALSE